jgi:hypothetical protein
MMHPLDALVPSTDTVAVLESLQQLMSVIETLPALSADDRQELRLTTWSYYVPLFMAAHLTQTKEEVDQLRRWYALPTSDSIS